MSTLAELADLQTDWDSYGAKPPSAEAMKTASNLTFVPMTSGGIQIEMHAGGIDLEIEVESDGAISSIYWGKP